MRSILSKYATVSAIALIVTLASCGKKNATNTASDLVNSPVGYWTTEDSKLGAIGWKINETNFKKCIIALDMKVTEQTGSVHINGSTVEYSYSDSKDPWTATYHSDDNTLTEDKLPKLKYVRADDKKVDELNSKGCHL